MAKTETAILASANLVSHTSAAKLLGDLVSGVSAIAAPGQEWAAAHERPS